MLYFDLSRCITMGKFSENLARIMREKDINQVELSKKSGVSQPRISGYLHESKWARVPNLKNLIALARALNCSLETLTGLESLEGIEKEADAIGELSAEEKAIIEAYNALPDDDWKKKAVEGMLLKGKEVEKKKDSGQ